MAGTPDRQQLAALEAHVDECRECFLRMVAAADDLPQEARASRLESSQVGSSIHSLLSFASRADTQLAAPPGSLPADWDRKTFGPYVLTGLLGLGGMGIVYRARHEQTGLEVAVKTVKTPVVASFMAMLRQEIEFLREAKHPGIVSILDSDLTAEEPWYAMELFEGPTLQEFNQRLWTGGAGAATDGLPPAAGGRLPDVLRLFARLCDPIGFIHSAGMVHGDIKPMNVFLRGEQDPVVMDFGLASRARGTVGREVLDVTGRLRGTLPYLAPESIRGQIPDARADLYALGCMLYESVVGLPPFVATTRLGVIDMHLSAAPRPASGLVAGVPPQLDRLLLQLLAKNPGDRFGHASVLGASLGSIADALSPSTGATAKTVVSSESTMPLFRSPIVGRDDEVARVMGAVQRARQVAAGGLFLVSGESGIGKTFFTAEVAQRAVLAGLSVMASECVPLAPAHDAAADAGTTPLQGFRRLFEGLRDRCLEHGPDETERLFGGRLAVLANTLPLLGHLRALAGPQEPPPPLPASAARERIVAAVVDTLAAYVDERPTLLALDDLQWADDLTLAVLERVVDELLDARPLIVMATCRSDESHERIRRLAGRPRSEVLQLPRLGKTEIAGMVGGMLSLQAPPDALIEFVHDHAEGVPFFAAEYLRTLVAAGALTCRDGAWSMRAESLATASLVPGHRFPTTLRELIAGRLRRLPPASVELLEAGAVVGRRFSLSLLARMADRPAGELAALLNGAVAAQITSTDGLDEYTFLHDKIRETLYGGLGDDRRAALHLSAARSLADGPPPPPDQYGPIAHHFRLGGDASRAVDHYEKAGAHALGLAANAEADRFLREALELEPQLPSGRSALRRARWLRQRGDALSGLGMMAESAEALKAAAALLGRAVPRSKVGFAFRLAWQIASQVKHRLWTRPPRRLPAGRNDVLVETGRLFERLHEVSYHLARDADLVLSTTVSLNAAERAGTAETRAIAYTNAGMMAGVLPARGLAERYFRMAHAALGATPEMFAEVWLLENEGHYRVWQGERQEAVRCLERVMALAEQAGFSRRQDEAECIRGAVDLFAGHHRSVLERADQVERRASKRRDSQIRCWTVLQRADCLLIRGEVEKALAEVATANTLMPAVGRPEKVWATGLEAHARSMLGEPGPALELLRAALELALRGPPVHSHCLTAYDRMTETALKLYLGAAGTPEAPGILRLAKQACAYLGKAGRVFPIIRPVAALHRGMLDLLLKRRRPGVVLRDWSAATEAARRMSLPLAELRLHRAILGQTDLAPALRDEALQRAHQLALEVAIDPDLPPPAASAGPLGGAVEIEGEVEQPNRG